MGVNLTAKMANWFVPGASLPIPFPVSPSGIVTFSGETISTHGRRVLLEAFLKCGFPHCTELDFPLPKLPALNLLSIFCISVRLDWWTWEIHGWRGRSQGKKALD